MGLFGPAWRTDNPRKLDRAIASVSRYAPPSYNEKMLIRIALEAPLEEVALAAVAHMKGFALSSTAQQSRRPAVAHAAAREVPDAGYIFQHIIDSDDALTSTRLIIVERMTSPSDLSYTVRKAREDEVRIAAAKRLTSLGELCRVIEKVSEEGNGPLLDVLCDASERALEAEKDQDVLADCACHPWKYATQAVELMNARTRAGQKRLASVVENGKDREACKRALERISDQGLLKDLALTDTKYAYDAMMRMDDSDDNAQGWLSTVAQRAKQDSVRRAAAERITNEDILADIVSRSSARWEYDKGHAALVRIHDQDILRTIATKEYDVFAEEAVEMLEAETPEGRDRLKHVSHYGKAAGKDAARRRLLKLEYADKVAISNDAEILQLIESLRRNWNDVKYMDSELCDEICEEALNAVSEDGLIRFATDFDGYSYHMNNYRILALKRLRTILKDTPREEEFVSTFRERLFASPADRQSVLRPMSHYYGVSVAEAAWLVGGTPWVHKLMDIVESAPDKGGYGELSVANTYAQELRDIYEVAGGRLGQVRQMRGLRYPKHVDYYDSYCASECEDRIVDLVF